MGICLSSSSGTDGRKFGPAATVISADGDLRRHSVPVTVFQVLEIEWQAAVPSPLKFFVCDSDRLDYNKYIAALDLDYELQENQIYFVLPVSRLQSKLSAADMAVLAVKASLALKTSPSGPTKQSSILRRRSRDGKQSKFARISPATEEYDSRNEKRVNQRVSHSMERSMAGLGVSRSGLAMKLQRYPSRRAKLAGRAFMNKLRETFKDYNAVVVIEAAAHLKVFYTNNVSECTSIGV